MSHPGPHIPGSCGCGFDPGYMEVETQGKEYSQLVGYIGSVVGSNLTDDSDASAFLSKPFGQRCAAAPTVESDVDEEILLAVRFTSQVKVKAFMVVGGARDTAPARFRVFVNAFDSITDFDTAASATPTQEWQLSSANESGVEELPTNFPKFTQVESLVFHIPSNLAEDEVTCLRYLGIRGVAGAALQANVVKTTYEARPQLADHQADLMQPGQQTRFGV